MIISYQLLQSFLATPLGMTPKELGERLTQHGLEVERYIPCPAKNCLALGKVIRIEQGHSILVHQESQEEITIACVLEQDTRYVLDSLSGAWAVSTPARLGWSSQTTPLWVPGGLSLEQAWEFEDTLIELSITPNRGDCLSYVGICREVALAQRIPFLKKTLLQSFKDRYKVVWDGPTEFDIQVDPKLAPFYAASKVYCPTRLQSPFWLQRFLIKHGLACRMPAVDISQYLMMIFGHPTHAFNGQALHEKLDVTLKAISTPLACGLLDGTTLTLTGTCPVIIGGCGNVVALPGLMGSQDSSAQIDCRDLIIESAFFDPTYIRQLRRFGVVTDASLRFERGVDRQGQTDILEIFCGMLQSMHPQVLCWSPLSRDHLTSDPYPMLRTTFEKLEALAGVALDRNEIDRVVTLIGGQIEGSHFSYLTPSWRFDLALEQNFLAEILRAYGIDRITLPASPIRERRHIECVEPALSPWIERGFNEVVTYSFGPKSWALIGTAEDELITLSHPLNQDLSVMRPSLWPSLLDVLGSNKRCGGQGLGVVEIAPIYHKKFSQSQKKVVSAALYVQKNLLSWNITHKNSQEWSYYAIKGLIEQMGCVQPFTWTPLAAEHPFLHPTLSATLMQGDRCVGYVGLIHPALAEKFHWPQAYLIEMDEDLWHNAKTPVYQSLSKYQKIERDFSFYCPPSIQAADIMKILTEHLHDLHSLEVFDYYCSDKGAPTLGIRGIFQSASKTLEDSEVNAMIQKALEILKSQLGVSLQSESF